MSETRSVGRSLASYRPQHDEGCQARRCICGQDRAPEPIGYTNEHRPKPCSCGLESALQRDAALREAPQRELEVCICAAVRLDDGRVIRGHRHHNCFPAAKEAGQTDLIRQDMQGFVTSRERYVDRAEGLALQMAAGIPSARGAYNGRALFSEDLY